MKILLRAWHMNTLDEWAMAAGITAGALIALYLLNFITARVLKAFASRKGGAYVAAVAEVAGATKIWLMLPIALYAGSSALALPDKLSRLMDVMAVVALILQVAVWTNRAIRVWLNHKISQRSVGDGEALTVLGMLAFAGRVLVWTVVLLLVLKNLNFDVSALLTGLGVGGVAVALAVQNVLGDLFASLSIVLDKPFVVGDFIVVDSLRGTVERIGIKTTRLRSLDGELLVFSNGDLLKSRIRNFKRMVDRRIEFTIGVDYVTPLDKLRRIPRWLREGIEAQQKVRFDRAHFKMYGESQLVFEAVYYVLDPDYNVYMDVQQAVNLGIFERFAREGVEFAFPTRVLQVRQQEAGGRRALAGAMS
jgi:small-conductance mechanosensitive channel